MYGTAPRMGFFVPIFVDVFVDTSTRGAKPYQPTPYRHNPPAPSAYRASGNPCAQGERNLPTPTLWQRPTDQKGNTMHVVSFQHRMQAARIADFLADTYGTLTKERGIPQLHTLCRFYAYTHALTDIELRLFTEYTRSLAEGVE